MNLVVMRLTLRGLIGRRRIWLLLALPSVLLLVAGLTRWGSGGNPETTASLTGNFAMGTLLPLMCLLVGTGVIGPEIEDGSIVYLLAKPLPRRTIALSKLAMAIVVALAFAVLPIMLAIAIAGDEGGQLTIAYGAASALASIAYVTIFFMLAIVSRNAVIIGLLYAVLWETVLGGYVPGVRALSVRQWALAPAEQLLGENANSWGVTSEVGLGTGLILLALTILIAVIIAVRRLQTIPLRTAE
jgi:ABC-2 type transport system permease protein